ncbi:hypothetical protein V2O64_19305 [Verrucomicrobiaceae bacterium 227]
MNVPLTTLFAVSLSAHSFAGSVWVEAEAAREKSIQDNGWYSNVKNEELSGGALLAHWGNRDGSAQYQIKVPEEGEYVLWLRANPVGTRLGLKIGDGEWADLKFEGQSHEQMNIAGDDKPDLRFVSWVRAGVQNLKEGELEIGVRFTSDNHHHGMLDCFCLTTDTEWKPGGVLKPGEEPPHWAVPDLTEANLDKWIQFIRPSEEELGWRAVRWHSSLSEAAEEAKALQRPILLWAMNGHPCGET